MLKPHYLQSGAIKRVYPNQYNKYISRCFFVSKNTGGYRLVIDLRHINKYFNAPKVKFENLAYLKAAPRSVQYGIKADISDAYHHLRLSDKI